MTYSYFFIRQKDTIYLNDVPQSDPPKWCRRLPPGDFQGYVTVTPEGSIVWPIVRCDVSQDALSHAAACVDGDIVDKNKSMYLAHNFQALIDVYTGRIAELEEQLAAALATIERATWCDVCSLPAEHCRENH